MTNRPSAAKKAKSRNVKAPDQASTWIWWAVAGVIIVAGIAAVFLTRSSSGSDIEFEQGDVTIEGEDLPAYESASGDSAVGQAAPSVTWTNVTEVETDAGEPTGTTEVATDETVEIDNSNGMPKVLIFLAHWCPHCQADVPVIQGWIDDNGMPQGVELVGVASLNDPSRGNFPPEEWLADENWTVPTMVDNDDNAVAQAYGLAGTPFFAVIDSDGKIVQRASGQIGADGFGQLVESARSGSAAAAA